MFSFSPSVGQGLRRACTPSPPVNGIWVFLLLPFGTISKLRPFLLLPQHAPWHRQMRRSAGAVLLGRLLGPCLQKLSCTPLEAAGQLTSHCFRLCRLGAFHTKCWQPSRCEARTKHKEHLTRGPRQLGHVAKAVKQHGHFSAQMQGVHRAK